jgi:hypothetical protein
MTGTDIAVIASSAAASMAAFFGFLRFWAYLRWLRKLRPDQRKDMREMIDAYRDTWLARVADALGKVLVAVLGRADRRPAGSTLLEDEPPREVPIAHPPDENLIIVRNGKSTGGSIVRFTPEEWRDFITQAKEGDFDILALKNEVEE